MGHRGPFDKDGTLHSLEIWRSQPRTNSGTGIRKRNMAIAWSTILDCFRSRHSIHEQILGSSYRAHRNQIENVDCISPPDGRTNQTYEPNAGRIPKPLHQ